MADLRLYESEAERNAVCAELSRMLRIVPLSSPVPVSAPPGQRWTPTAAGTGDLYEQGVSA